MANNKTTWWSEQVLKALEGTAPTIPASGSFYVALFTADPGVGGGFTNEFANSTSSWSGYARQQVSLNAVTSNTVTDSATINFPANASTGSVTVAGWALVDSPTIGSGNMYYRGAFATPQTVANGQPFQIPSGQISIQEQ